MDLISDFDFAINLSFVLILYSVLYKQVLLKLFMFAIMSLIRLKHFARGFNVLKKIILHILWCE